MADKPIRVVELFAGVGGFRLGLESSSPRFKTVWANQWEPGKKSQHAFDCYVAHFGESKAHVNEDIALVKDSVPAHDLLVGGFPCQDYSVAHPLPTSKGIEGKKGVLWWEIRDIVNARKPKYILLENVDRLLRSPASQRGRDFGIILRCLADEGYAVEWRAINAADYGQAQRRRRVFIFACLKGTPIYKKLAKQLSGSTPDSSQEWLSQDGFFAPAFPVNPVPVSRKQAFGKLIRGEWSELADFSDQFKSDFYYSGVMIHHEYYSAQFEPINEKPISLGQIRETGAVSNKYFLGDNLEKWQYLKGSKKIKRTSKIGISYTFSEGGIAFPDSLGLPGRTMLTSESSVNRTTHVIEDAETRQLRLLTPLECERLNGFPDGWTDTGMPEKFRYFTMGNALVVPLVRRMGEQLSTIF